MRRGDHNAVGKVFAFKALGAIFGTVVSQNSLGDHWGRSVVIARVDAHAHAVGDENLDSGLPCRKRESMSVATQVQRASNTCLLPFLGNGLSNRNDMGFVEGAVQASAAVARGTEGDALRRVLRVRDEVVILGKNLVHVDEISWGSGHSRVLCNHDSYSSTPAGQLSFAQRYRLGLRVRGKRRDEKSANVGKRRQAFRDGHCSLAGTRVTARSWTRSEKCS